MMSFSRLEGNSGSTRDSTLTLASIQKIETIISKIGKIAGEKNIDFLDYSKDTLFFNNPKLFDDTVHVNAAGSKIFSAMIAGDLKKRLTAQ